MKKFFVILSLLFLSMPAMADCCAVSGKNPFMGTHQNQFGFGIGQGFDTGWLLPPPTRPVLFYIGNFTYSQPTTFFRMPARRSINISQTVGFHERYGWEWQDYSIPMAYVSEDIPLFWYKRFYMGTGAGVGLQAKQNERLGAKLIFQFKVMFGFNINKQWTTELFIQHFSNANTADANHSYAFYGFGFTYSY